MVQQNFIFYKGRLGLQLSHLRRRRKVMCVKTAGQRFHSTLPSNHALYGMNEKKKKNTFQSDNIMLKNPRKSYVEIHALHGSL